MRRTPLSRLAAIAIVATMVAAGLSGPAHAEPDMATIQGRFTSGSGAALSNFNVQIQPIAPGGSHGWVYTDWEGNYSAQVRPGRYRIMFYRPPDSPSFAGGPFIQYVPGTDVTEQATAFEVTAGQTLTVNETMYPVGSVSGRFTDADGNPLANVGVTPSRADLPMFVFTHTDADGRYRFDRLRANPAWRIQFIGSGYGFAQYAFGQVYAQNATPIAVVAGQDTVIDDSKLPTGGIRVIARDAVTGTVVPRFQANLNIYGAGYAEGEDGVATISGVPIGAHRMTVSAYGFEDIEGQPVTVQVGPETEVTVALRPKTRIDAKVVDAATGQPLEGMCLVVAKPMRFQLPDGCSSSSSAGGRGVVEVYEPGWYQVFAFPVEAPGYGAQWIGANGGSGRQLQARLIKVEAGKVATAPVIKVDRAGTIAGRLTAPDGTPVSGWVSTGDWSTFVGGGLGVVEADEQGRYSLDYLGPYRWPLRFQGFGQATQYSGGVANRHLAATIPVTAGQTTAYDHPFAAGATLVADINGVTGFCYLLASNVATEEIVGLSYVDDCTQPSTVRLVGPQLVKLRVMTETADRSFDQPVLMPSSGTKQITLDF